ncbi:hypothetical protein EYF80_026911 [Liparis tanakae]|uniref:Uncharacterized protein n=1 Tax=Liparis tanakae TaxID=230148 RepID=A0A4Z2HAP7_9TELE|nr:hypothetical protein EYF80_026911 [Liparis tanakae]
MAEDLEAEGRVVLLEQHIGLTKRPTQRRGGRRVGGVWEESGSRRFRLTASPTVPSGVSGHVTFTVQANGPLRRQGGVTREMLLSPLRTSTVSGPVELNSFTNLHLLKERT